MLIVRGVNVFPSAVREVVNAFAPKVSGHILVRPREPGVKQEPPLPVAVELARGHDSDDELALAIGERLRSVLVVQAESSSSRGEACSGASTSRSSSSAERCGHL
jgi:phenylacetate-CoA ligase